MRAAATAGMLLLALGASSPTRAERPAPSPFWSDVAAPGRARARVLIRHGLARLYESVRLGLAQEDARARIMARSAAARFRAATEHDPESALPYRLLAQALEKAEGVDATYEKRRAALLRTRALDPELDAAGVAFDLGILDTIAGNFEQAITEYRRAVDATLMPQFGPIPEHHLWEERLLPRFRSTHVAYYNMGDVAMSLGNPKRALEAYERGMAEAKRVLAFDPQAQSTIVLVTWSMAGARDRLGDPEAALRTAREALRLDPQLEQLRSPGVFFEPARERHYYEGLGFMARAEATESDEPRRAALTEAERAWQLFLQQGGTESPWAGLARAHLAEVRRALRRPRR